MQFARSVGSGLLSLISGGGFASLVVGAASDPVHRLWWREALAVRHSRLCSLRSGLSHSARRASHGRGNTASDEARRAAGAGAPQGLQPVARHRAMRAGLAFKRVPLATNAVRRVKRGIEIAAMAGEPGSLRRPRGQNHRTGGK